MNSRTYRIGASNLTLVFGDLTKSSADVLVSSDDDMLSMGGGVSAALRRAAGESLVIDAAKRIPARKADVVVTTAGVLPARHIFHAITIGGDEDKISTKEIIERTTRRSLELLEHLGLSSIAFPAISAGVAGFDYNDVAVRMADVICDYLLQKEQSFQVSIFLFDRFGQKSPIEFVRFFEEFATKAQKIPNPTSLTTLENDGEDMQTPSHEVDLRQQTTKLLSELNQERDQIESQLAEFEGAFAQKELEKLEYRLNEIHKSRIDILTTMNSKNGCGVSVFVSYSHKDREYKERFMTFLKSLERHELIKTWHDRMIVAGTEWQGQIHEQLDSCRIIILLISADFIASEYCFDKEMERALERHHARNALVIPIIIRPAVWDDMPFAKLQALPSNTTPVSVWQDEDLAWVDVAQGIKTAIKDLDNILLS